MMNKRKKQILIVVCLVLIATLVTSSSVIAQDVGDRPVVAISGYVPSTTPSRGENFSMAITLINSGQRAAKNIFIEFVSGDLIPRNNGGQQTVYQLIENESKGISQAFSVSPDLWGVTMANLMVNIEYYDYDGNVYTDSFTLAIDLHVPAYSVPDPTPTPTPTTILQPQLVIQSYTTDVEILQPGTKFELSLDIVNLGNAVAKAVSLVLGGGSVEVNPEGTPQPGISGGQGEFNNFAPLESSNIVYIGDIGPGKTISARQQIIVNVSTAPGAYSLKYSLIYATENGEKCVDNQVITLLIYRMPAIEVGFYQDPGPIFASQMNNLPLQIMNLGKNPVVLGNMTVSAADAQLENNTAMVGPIETGFYFTLDTMIIPFSTGPLEVLISVNYTDDFNQPRVYETVLTLEVLEFTGMSGVPGVSPAQPTGGPGMAPGADTPSGGPLSGQPETFWQKVLRIIKGLVGLDSGTNAERFSPEAMPPGGLDEGGYETVPVKGP